MTTLLISPSTTCTISSIFKSYPCDQMFAQPRQFCTSLNSCNSDCLCIQWKIRSRNVKHRVLSAKFAPQILQRRCKFYFKTQPEFILSSKKFYFQTQPEIHVIFHKIQDSIFKLNLKYILSSTKGIAKGFTGLKRFVLIKPTKSNQEVRTVFDESVDVVGI